MDIELRNYLDSYTDDLVRSGLPREEAQRQARLQLGALESLKEECRDARGPRLAETLLQDFRYALRTLLKNPGFAAVTILTLALGIGANTAIFSIVNAVLLRPLEFSQPEQLVQISNTYPLGAFVAMRPALRTMDVATYQEGTEFNLTGLGQPQRLYGSSVSAEFFGLLGVTPKLGRVFTAGEDRPGQNRFAILSQGLWEEKFNSDPNILGKLITLEGAIRQVVGVMPATFQFPSAKTQVWVPLNFDPTNIAGMWGGPFLPVLGRLHSDVTLEKAHADLVQFTPRVVSMFPWKMPDNWKTAGLVSLQRGLVGDVQTKLWLLLGAVALVLLIACANVANLLLSRAATREREIAVRSALGAGRGRIFRQLLTESVILAIMGGFFGVLLAINGFSWLKTILPSDTPRMGSLSIDWRVMVFAIVLSLLTGLVFGLAPAFFTSKINLTNSLKIGTRESAPMRMGAHGLRNLLVVGEIALAMILVSGAGLLVKSLWELSHVNPGFQAESIVTARITPNESFCAEFARCLGFYGDLLDRTRALPDAQDAALVNVLPLNGRTDGFAADLEGIPRPSDNSAPMFFQTVITADYLYLMRIPLLEGRAFTRADESPSAAPVALLAASAARKYWPNQSAVGKHIKPVFVDTWMTIVGVVGDVNEDSLASRLPPWTEGAVYVPYGNASLLTAQHARRQPNEMTLVMRTTMNEVVAQSELRGAVSNLNSDVPVSEVTSMGAIVSKSEAAPRSTMLLFAIFAALAIALGAVGIYGVVSYSVSQRTREIGVRVALGAESTAVLRMVLGQGMKLALMGVTLGLAASLALTQVMKSMLYGVTPSDPLTFLLVTAILVVIALAACYIPARRATRLDPLVALRHE
jgi:predicted permease